MVTITIDEAARRFLITMPAGQREASQQEIYRFVRWYGGGKTCQDLKPPQVASYAEQLTQTDTDNVKKLEQVRDFLVYMRKQGWTDTNLAVHLKLKKGKTRQAAQSDKALPEGAQLTREGYASLEAELAELKEKRTRSIEEVRRAAADKDFRENAPLAAAREQRGHIEGRIREIEETLKTAKIIIGKPAVVLKAGIGDNVVLQDIVTGEECRYMLVSPTEVDPARFRISSSSPLGKSIMGKAEGDIIEVAVPAGKLRYQLKRIER